MALFVDGPPSGIEDLRGYDSQLDDVAVAERIDVSHKLAIAQQEIGTELESLAGVGLANVVNTQALTMWHAYRSLEMVYGDAYYSQLNDRYASKRNHYREQARWAREQLRQVGLGLTLEPVRRALPPEVLFTPGSLPDGTYFVTAAWVNSLDEEGCCSTPVTITTNHNTLQVRLTDAPMNAKGWNVYVGRGPDEMTRQNPAPLEPALAWVQPGMLADGSKAGVGQQPTYLRQLPRVLERG